MAVVGPALVSDTTNTSGTGSLTLNNASSDGRRGLADAVTNGDAANSDTVHYLILDSGTSGSSLGFEKGEGTISDSGATLSRDTVHQSSNSGNKVSWPSGGTRDVLIAVGIEDLLVAANNLSDLPSASTARTNLDVPGLSTENAFTQDQNIDKAGAAATMRVRSDRGANADIPAFVSLAGHDSDGNDTDYARMYTQIADNTDGSEDAVFIVQLMSGGAMTTRLRLEQDGTLRQSAVGNKYDAFPSGQQLTSHTVPPTGWSRVNQAGERVVKLAESGDTVGATGGSWTISGLSASGNDAHTHGSEYATTSVDANLDGTTKSVVNDISDDLGPTGTSWLTTSTGSGMTISSSGGWRPAYRIACIMEKD